jgi:hypothetical protein
VAISQGFSDEWNYFYRPNEETTESPLAPLFWLSWILGPMLGASVAPLINNYVKGVTDAFQEKP